MKFNINGAIIFASVVGFLFFILLPLMILFIGEVNVFQELFWFKLSETGVVLAFILGGCLPDEEGSIYD